MQAVVGAVHVKFGNVAIGVIEVIAVVFVVQGAHVGRAFQVEVAGTSLQKFHLGQDAAAHVPGVAVAVDVGTVIEGIVRRIGALAVLKEGSGAKLAGSGLNACSKACHMGDCAHINA